jgi:hypothetical protein
MFDQGALVLKPQPEGYCQAESPRLFPLKLLTLDAKTLGRPPLASGQNRLDHKPWNLWSSNRCAGGDWRAVYRRFLGVRETDRGVRNRATPKSRVSMVDGVACIRRRSELGSLPRATSRRSA